MSGCGRGETYEIPPFVGTLGSKPRQERRDTIRNPVLRERRTAGCQCIPIKGRILDKAEDSDDGSSNGPKRPPEHIRPRLTLCDESAQSPAADDSEDDENLKDSEGLPAVMQVEHVNDVPAAEDGRDAAEESSDKSRHSERDEIVRAGHLSTPDLAGEDSHQAPENDRAATDDCDKRDKQERTGDPACQTGRNRVQHILLSHAIARDLVDEGDLVAVGRHLRREGGQTDADEDRKFLMGWPGLQILVILLEFGGWT